MATKTVVPRFASDLHVHSGHSIYDGLGSPKSIVERAVELRWGAVCLTEHGNVASAPALYAAARAAKIKPIIGCEMYVCPDEALVDGDKAVLKDRRHLTVLALSYEGYQNLIRWNDVAMERPLYYNGPRISLERMGETAEHGLHHNVVLSGCLGGELCQCLLHANGNARQLGRMYLETARDIFPNFYVEIQNQALDKFLGIGMTSYEQMVSSQFVANEHLLALAQELAIPVILTNDSHYQTSAQRRPHMAMLARKQWRRARDSHEGETRDSNVDEFAAQYAQYGAYMRSMESIAETLPAWARDQAIQSIQDIVAEADVHLDPLDNFVYALPRSRSEDPIEEVRRRTRGRMKTMIQRHGQVAIDRFEYELSALKDFSHYLLIYADIIKMARSQGTYTWTRGSGCASLVLYCLGVHQIDPIHYELLFERFVNPARVKFPDVDLDIEAHRRDDVAKMVRDYMHDLGQEVYAICTYSTLSNRNTFRLMAEAAGVDKEKIDELAKLLPQMIDSGMVNSDEEAYEVLREEYGLDLHADATAIFDTIGGFSQHACAFVIGTAERPLSDWVPTYRIGSSDALVTQYNMKWIENMGFLKLDLLKLDTLSILHDVARQLGEDMDWIDSLGRTAPGIYDEHVPAAMVRLREGRTDGIFTFQGGTQRRGCIEVAPETTQDLVAIQALYRPGATRTGNDKKFVARRRGEEDWEHVNDVTEARWDATYGIPIFQEQIMELGFDLGMTGEEVDELYKAIKLAKGVGRGAAEAFEKFEPTFRKYVANMPKEQADAIWAEFDRMQGYSFNKAHATSFAILGYKSAICMAEHPLETYVSLLRRYPNNPRYIAAAISDGFHFETPDVNRSTYAFSKGSTDKSILIGFLRVDGIGPGAAGDLVRNQPFNSIDDVKARTNSSRVKAPTIKALREIGAFECFGISGDDDDVTSLNLLGMVPRRPIAFKGIKPQVRKQGANSRWKFLGLERGLSLTFGKVFCAKMFWIPAGTSLSLKANDRGTYNAYLLPVVDENGIVFDLQVSESKEHEVKLIKELAKCHDAVICAEGQISLPFLRGGNTSFKLWGVARAEEGNPQIWGVDEDVAHRVVRYAKAKELSRRAR